MVCEHRRSRYCRMLVMCIWKPFAKLITLAWNLLVKLITLAWNLLAKLLTLVRVCNDLLPLLRVLFEAYGLSLFNNNLCPADQNFVRLPAFCHKTRQYQLDMEREYWNGLSISSVWTLLLPYAISFAISFVKDFWHKISSLFSF